MELTKQELRGANSWMEQLTPDQKEALISSSTILKFRRGETIIKQGTLASQIMFLEEGMAKLNFMEADKDTTFSFATNGDFIGLMCSFVQKRLEFSAIAITNATVRIIDREVFENSIKENGKFAVYIVKLMSELTNGVVHTLISLSHKNVNGALSTLLLSLSRVYASNTFQIPFTRDEMAAALGYSKESIINTLSEFHRDKIINISGRNLVILQPETLKIISARG
jgi:CRP-like cAMP-binding protein